jgi:DNA-binding NarL/FixJ family response regulator
VYHDGPAFDDPARELGMRPLEERVRRRLEELEHTAERGASARPAGLTEREAQVLNLVSLGRTNKEIASALFISEKTVVNHVTHIFAKIGVGNRTEASRFASQHGL